MDKGKKRNLSEVAADYVREQILQGKLAQREKLVENDIAVTLGMSRGPVRDALKQLMYEGFLDYETNKGYSVSMLSPKDAYEIFFLRGNLENLALERCGGRLLSDSIFLMEDAVLAMKEAVAEDDMGRTRRQDHHLLAPGPHGGHRRPWRRGLHIQPCAVLYLRPEIRN